MIQKFEYDMVKNKYKLSESEGHVLQYIMEHIQTLDELGIRDVALECFCSTSVIMSLSKKLGYNGYKDMIERIEGELKGNIQQLEKNVKYLQEFTNFSNENAKLFIQLLKEHKEQAIYLIGSGFCEPLTNYMQDKLMVLGFKSFCTWHTENYWEPLTKKPLVICVSKSGETDYAVRLAQNCQQQGYDIISFTHRKTNTLMQMSTLNFNLFDSAILNESNAISNSFYPIVLFLFEHLIGCYLDSDNDTFLE